MNHQLYVTQRLASARGQALQERAARSRTRRLARQAGSPTIHNQVKEDPASTPKSRRQTRSGQCLLARCWWCCSSAIPCACRAR